MPRSIGKRVVLHLAACALFLSGCSAPLFCKTDLPEVKESRGLASNEISVEPQCVQPGFGACRIKLGLSRDSSMPAGQVIITALTNSGDPIDPEIPLRLEVDGEASCLKPLKEKPTSFFVGGTEWQSMRYETDRETLEKLNGGQEATARLALANGAVEESFLMECETGGAITAVRMFLKRTGGHGK